MILYYRNSVLNFTCCDSINLLLLLNKKLFSVHFFMIRSMFGTLPWWWWWAFTRRWRRRTRSSFMMFWFFSSIISSFTPTPTRSTMMFTSASRTRLLSFTLFRRSWFLPGLGNWFYSLLGFLYCRLFLIFQINLLISKLYNISF
jgi:hypothetical protein